MIIQPLGPNGFKISAGDTTVAVNPPSSKSAHKVPKCGADILFISTPHPDWNGEETVSLGGKDPFIIRSPGAYEVGPVVAHGYHSETALFQEPTPYGNTTYLIRFDGMTLLVLGALSGKIPSELREDIESVDILFVPLGEMLLTPKQAHELAVSVEPRVIIPAGVTQKKDREEFLEFEGAKGKKPVEKLTLRAKEVAQYSGEVVLFS